MLKKFKTEQAKLEKFKHKKFGQNMCINLRIYAPKTEELR